ncbi:ferric-chelate reductase 1 [Kryptolebias marmoratus]|uniref:ferric-chelate reductase 1 n=1 Tax=Kryptolebias marmoratus TaxID=37003 RepID=UPI0007F8FA07|nr:ferric-chelate reductase 1 [Kryptolebias marmoratus]
MLLLLLLALTGFVVTVSGYSRGQVGVSCRDLVPQHGYEPSQDSPPYSLTVDRSTFSPGDQITVSLTVASSSSIYFKGFLIEARDASSLNSPAVGFFNLTETNEAQVLKCGQNQGSALSHKDSSRKTHIQAVWVSPRNTPSRVQFLVTVVQEYKVYWVRIAGPVVSLRGATASPTTSAQTCSVTTLSAPFSSVGCGVNKSCLRDPVDCDPRSDPHCFFLSFTPSESDESVMFEVSGPADGYLAFALSLDKWMGNDDIYLCVNNGGRTIITAGFVSGRSQPELETETTLWGRASRLVNGVIQCRFHRNIIQRNRFDLNLSYYIFLAHGRTHQGLINRHDYQPLISTSQKMVTGPPQDFGGSHSNLLIKFHAVLMLTAWMWTVSTAIFIARHCKNLWCDTTLLGQKVWFQLHRSMMALSVGLSCVAFILPFIYRGGWKQPADSHHFTGWVVITLTVIQSIMAILRPSLQSPRRVLFKWMHFGAGTVGQILAGKMTNLEGHFSGDTQSDWWKILQLA